MNTTRESHLSVRRTATAVFLLGAILVGARAHAHSAPAWVSANSFGGSGSDIGLAVKVDRDGNRYVTGDFSATGSFPTQAAADRADDHKRHSGSSTTQSLTSAGGTDMFLAKYDRSGRLKWLLQAGGPEDDQGFDIAFDEAQNVYVTGVFADSATFHGTRGTPISVSGIGQSIFLAKYRPSGELVWVQTGTAEFDSSNNGYGVAIDATRGFVYVTGVAQGNTHFSSSDGSAPIVPGPGTWHMYLAKYDTDGRFQWGQFNEASPNTVAHKVAVDAQGNAYATGWMEGETTFYSGDGNNQTIEGFSQPVQSYPDYPGDGYIVKYDSNGNLKWINHIGGYKGIGTEVAVSHDGKVTFTGIVGNIDGDASQSETIVTSQPGGSDRSLGGGIFTSPFNTDVFIATFDEAGVLLDARRYGGALNDGGSGLAYDHEGNLIFEGIFQGSIDIEGRTLTGNDAYSLFVGKFSANDKGHGEGYWDRHHHFAGFRLDWLKSADGPGIDGFENDPRIALTDDEDVLVTGAYEPAAQFDTFEFTSAGLEDGFLALLKPSDHEDR